VELTEVRELCDRVRAEIARVVVGQEEIVDALLVGLLVGGHVLLEGPPGTAKTLLAHAFAKSLNLGFKRVQFTPDLLPGDVLGTNLFNFQTSQFTLNKGAIFTDLLLADEVNRTPPKTQAALLQAMQERAVTLDGTTYPLSPTFLVMATQNPIEQEGTYPLPEAQLDRFLLKLSVGYPERDQEREIVKRHGQSGVMPRLEDFGLGSVVDSGQVLAARASVAALRLAPEIVDYVVDLTRATREHRALLHGASPRAASMLALASRALAALRGRDFVIPDDVKALFCNAMRHRVILAPAAEVEGLGSDAVLRQILDAVPTPR
jgi:MoxR-like ATPase